MPSPAARPEGTFASRPFRRRERQWQRVGLALLMALIAGSAAGLLSDDPTTVLRAAAVYGLLLAVFRIVGRRALAHITTFDFVLLLVIGDLTQQAIVGQDNTISTAAVAISTLILLDVSLGKVKNRWPRLDVVADGLPVILVAHGRPNADFMESEGIGVDDVLTAAREAHGLTRLEDVEYAVLERGGGISIVPR